MRRRWGLTWLLCAALAISLGAVWEWRTPSDAANAGSVVAAVIGLFSAMTVWAWRRDPRCGQSSSAHLTDALDVMARLVHRQWQDEASRRQVFDPLPLPVSWADLPLPDVSDHRQLIGDPFACRADVPGELAAAFRTLPRRRLVVVGDAGTGKTTFAMLLTLALLGDRAADEPVPVLLSLSSFDPSRESVQAWLRRRIAADYPVLADRDAYGPTVVKDLLLEGRIMPVLDGLDELPTAGRLAALAAFNEHFPSGASVVLTCRTTEYVTAVEEVGVLPGAAVIAPASLQPTEVLAVLRLATPPGRRQERWTALAEHVHATPDGPVAQSLTNPLMVALARAVYADASGDPAELADPHRFPTAVAIEHHLLDELLPTLYARERRRDPSAGRWGQDGAHRYLTYLARGLCRQGTHDLAWWQLYRWLHLLARPWARSLLWGGSACVLYISAITPWTVVFDASLWTFFKAFVWLDLPWVVALIVMQLVAVRLSAGLWSRDHAISAAIVISACGGLAGGAASVWVYFPELFRWDVFLSGAVWLGFSSLMVLLGTGLPAPPRAPSRGTFTLTNWPRRLRRTAVTVVVGAILGGVGLTLFLLAVDERPSWEVWLYGLGVGTGLGLGQSALQWVRGAASSDDLTTPVNSVRGDRLVTVINAAIGSVLFSLPRTALDVVEHQEARTVTSLLEIFDSHALSVCAFGVVLAVIPHAWSHYTAARCLMAVRGRLPWRLQAFLADAHRLGVLRQVGPVYQFRHARLRDRLAAGPTRLPGPRVAPRADPSRRGT